MLTLFSVPKPFLGHIKVIQENALQSWVRLSPPCEIILFGDEEGIAEAAAHFDVRHVPDVSRNEYGTPLLDDVFLRAQGLAANDLMCYINADIILMSDFMKAVEVARKSGNPFLMVGKRWNIDVEDPLDFSQPEWEKHFRYSVYQAGQSMPSNMIDYFVFLRGFYTDLLPFAIGRTTYDNWLLWKARSMGASIIDASERAMAVHQNHDYLHHTGGKNGLYSGVEAQRNRQLKGGWHHFFTLDDASHRLTSSGIRLHLSRRRLARKIIRTMYWLLGGELTFRSRLGLDKKS